MSYCFRKNLILSFLILEFVNFLCFCFLSQYQILVFLHQINTVLLPWTPSQSTKRISLQKNTFIVQNHRSFKLYIFQTYLESATCTLEFVLWLLPVPKCLIESTVQKAKRLLCCHFTLHNHNAFSDSLNNRARGFCG